MAKTKAGNRGQGKKNVPVKPYTRTGKEFEVIDVVPQIRVI
jgi:hypothetical protein